MTHPLETTVAGEKEVLLSFLVGAQRVLARKVDGLADDDARRAMVPSGTSLSGLINHAAYVQAGWLEEVFLGVEEGAILPPTEGWSSIPDDIEILLDRFRRQSRAVRQIVVDHDLDELNRGGDQPGTVSLRWIVVHLIEELSRHAGHMDILREQIDGQTGYP